MWIHFLRLISHVECWVSFICLYLGFLKIIYKIIWGNLTSDQIHFWNNNKLVLVNKRFLLQRIFFEVSRDLAFLWTIHHSRLPTTVLFWQSLKEQKGYILTSSAVKLEPSADQLLTVDNHWNRINIGPNPSWLLTTTKSKQPADQLTRLIT